MTEERAPYGQAGDLADEAKKEPASGGTDGRQNGADMATTLDPNVTTVPVQFQERKSFPVQFKSPEDLLHEQLLRVQGARSTVAGMKAEVEELKRDFDRRNAAVLQALDDARARLADDERILRAVAVELFSLTHEKQVAPGVAIREVTRTEYNEVEALHWAVEHRIYLELDRRGFEKFAKQQPAQVPFVRVFVEPEATISQDLSKALGSEAGE